MFNINSDFKKILAQFLLSTSESNQNFDELEYFKLIQSYLLDELKRRKKQAYYMNKQDEIYPEGTVFYTDQFFSEDKIKAQ